MFIVANKCLELLVWYIPSLQRFTRLTSQRLGDFPLLQNLGFSLAEIGAIHAINDNTVMMMLWAHIECTFIVLTSRLKAFINLCPYKKYTFTGSEKHNPPSVTKYMCLGTAHW